ncbi:MAG: hypothetical protein M5U28_02515 [Sandaracinaceae bacterium]|nr:hypothetical protein [Sandaracinaceae bacterium]
MAPQHHTPPAASRAQVCVSPAESETARRRPRTPTGAAREVVVPSPSWPAPFAPAQITEPSRRAAQAWAAPTAIATASVASVRRRGGAGAGSGGPKGPSCP